MSLMRATEVLCEAALQHAPIADSIELAYEERYRRRMRFVARAGTIFLLDLPRATLLKAGDALRLEDGRLIGIEAAPEELIEVTARDPTALARWAWHIGNRHVPAQIEPRRILIRDDPVIVDMLRGLGALARPIRAGFAPEGGAYPSLHAKPDHDHAHSPTASERDP